MQLTTILRQSAVRTVAGITSKKRLFQALGEIAHDVHGYEPARVVEALQERESLGPTGVGHGVALPHARLDCVEGVTGCFVRLDSAIDFGAVDRRPVDLVFALFAPSSSGVEHLRALACVSRAMRDPRICAKLRANDDPAALHAILTEDAVRQAA